MRVAPSHLRGTSSSGVPPPSYSKVTTTAETSGATVDADADVPPSTASDDSNIRRTLDHVLTVQTAQG